MRTSALLLMLAGLAAVASTGAAQGPDGLLACAPDVEALTNDIRIPHPAAHAQFTILTRLSDVSSAEVTAITAQLDDGSGPVPIPTPGPGTVSGATLSFPPLASRYVITISWTQGPEPFLSDACLGSDRMKVKVGPSATQVRVYLRKAGRAQRLWLQHRARYSAILDAYRAQVPDQGAGPAEFAALHAAARAALAKLPALRAISQRYATLVEASDPPGGLGEVNGHLSTTAFRFDSDVTQMFADLAQASTIADVTAAFRASDRRDARWNADRVAWRKTVTAASRGAGVPLPRWASRVGKPR